MAFINGFPVISKFRGLNDSETGYSQLLLSSLTECGTKVLRNLAVLVRHTLFLRKKGLKIGVLWALECIKRLLKLKKKNIRVFLKSTESKYRNTE